MAYRPTDEQVFDWKQKHGSIYFIEVEDKACVVRKPSRKALGYASAVMKNDPLKFSEILLADCWLAGDEEIKTNDALFMGVSQKIPDLIEVKEATLVKL